MKSKQLLSVVFSLILVMGLSAGSAFAQTDEDIDDTSMDNESVDAQDTEAKDEYDDHDEYKDEYEDEKYHDGKIYDLDDRLEFFCSMTDTEKRQLFADHPRLTQFKDRIMNFCELGEDEREKAIDKFVETHFPEIEYDGDHREMLDRYCLLSDEDKRIFVSKHDKAEEQVAKMNRYCTLDEKQRHDFIIEHRDEYIAKIKDKVKDHMGNVKDHMTDKVKDRIKDRFSHVEFDRFCAMSAEELAAATFEMEFVERASKWCDMTPDERKAYIKDHMKDAVTDKVKDHMKDKFSHMDYDRLCALAESDRAAEITDVSSLERLSKMCMMTPDERRDYIKDHIKDAVTDKVHDKVMDKIHDKMIDSPRLKEMIMAKSVTDEQREKIKLKFMEKFGDKADKVKSELKIKYKDHVDKSKSKFSDERKSVIHDRIAEMKEFKAKLRVNASDLSEEEKQQLRADFIEKAKDMQLAWISPRVQMNAGVDIGDIQCREGFSLAMKASNGVAMCLKADTALKLIDKGIAVPAN